MKSLEKILIDFLHYKQLRKLFLTGTFIMTMIYF